MPMALLRGDVRLGKRAEPNDKAAVSSRAATITQIPLRWKKSFKKPPFLSVSHTPGGVEVYRTVTPN